MNVLLPIVMLLLSFTSLLNGQVSAVDLETKPDVNEKLSAIIKDFPDGTNIAIALVQGDSASFYGFHKSNRQTEIVANQDDLFQMGSISKVFTATSLAIMHLDGRLELTDTINSHFNFPFKDDAVITFQELATHSSGLERLPSNLKLSSILNPYKDYTGKQLEEYLENELTVKPKTYAYSNLGAGLLGYTLAKIQGRSYNEMIQATIAFPLGMTTTTQYPDSSMSSRLVVGLGATGDPVPYWDMDALAGAGALFTTSSDLSKLIIAEFDSDQKALKLSQKAQLAVNEQMSIGLGWHILHKEGRNDWFWHNGGVIGFTSSLGFDPKKRVGVVVLSNVSAFHDHARNIDKLCFDLLQDL